jgi:hypothetical protein
MNMLLVSFYKIFCGQVISRAEEAYGHWVVTLVPYFSVENLETLHPMKL